MALWAILTLDSLVVTTADRLQFITDSSQKIPFTVTTAMRRLTVTTSLGAVPAGPYQSLAIAAAYRGLLHCIGQKNRDGFFGPVEIIVPGHQFDVHILSIFPGTGEPQEVPNPVCVDWGQ